MANRNTVYSSNFGKFHLEFKQTWLYSHFGIKASCVQLPLCHFFSAEPLPKELTPSRDRKGGLRGVCPTQKFIPKPFYISSFDSTNALAALSSNRNIFKNLLKYFQDFI